MTTRHEQQLVRRDASVPSENRPEDAKAHGFCGGDRLPGKKGDDIWLI